MNSIAQAKRSADDACAVYAGKDECCRVCAMHAGKEECRRVQVACCRERGVLNVCVQHVQAKRSDYRWYMCVLCLQA